MAKAGSKKSASAAEEKVRVKKMITRLANAYPDAKCRLNFASPLELLVATIMAAQCTDDRVNMVTEKLFKKYRTAEDFMKIPLPKLEEAIRSTGFFRNKAKSIKKCCTSLVEKHGGTVPSTMEELVALGGVGRKTANVILGNAFGKPAFIVDTHVKRVTPRLGLTRETDPDKIEAGVAPLIPEKSMTLFSHLLAFLGRDVCVPKKPWCSRCCIEPLCPYDGEKR